MCMCMCVCVTKEIVRNDDAKRECKETNMSATLSPPLSYIQIQSSAYVVCQRKKKDNRFSFLFFQDSF